MMMDTDKTSFVDRSRVDPEIVMFERRISGPIGGCTNYFGRNTVSNFVRT